MAENLFECDKCYSEYLPKINEELSTEVDGVNEMCVTKRVCPILILLPAMGINIKESKSTKCEIFRWFYLLVMLLIAMWLSGWQLYQLANYRFAQVGHYYVSHIYQYVVVAVVYVAAFKNQKTGQLLKDTLSLYDEMVDLCGANRILKRQLWPLWVITTINIVVMGCLTIAMDWDTHYDIYLYWFPDQFFGIQSDSTVVVHTVFLATFIGYWFCFSLFNLFGCFAIFQCFLIKECFNGLHIKLKANGDRHLRDYLIGHSQISRLVDRFNKIFHPAILAMVCFLVINLVSLTADVIRIIQITTTPMDYKQRLITVSTSILLAQAVMVFTVFVYFANEIQCEARKGIQILQEYSVFVTSSTNEETHHKNAQIALFVARLNAAPVAISASGLFDINVNVITVIVSIAVTYFTLVFSASDESEKERTQNSLSSLSTELTSLSNNLSSLSNMVSATLNCSKD